MALGSPPDDFRDAKGEVAGWEIDIMRAATEALGLTLEFRPTTFDTLIPGLQAKRFDAATGQMGITEAREKVLDMVGTLIGNELFAALSDKDIKVTGAGRPVRRDRGDDTRLARDGVRGGPPGQMRGCREAADQRAGVQ